MYSFRPDRVHLQGDVPVSADVNRANPIGMNLDRLKNKIAELDGDRLVRVLRDHEDMPLSRPIKRPLEDGHQLFCAKKASEHADK